MGTIPRLSRVGLAGATQELARRDAGLARLLAEDGVPPIWSRPTGFPTLVHIVLEQQVPIASALAAFRRLKRRCRPLTAPRFLALGDDELRHVGFSKQKIGYCRQLATQIASRRLVLRRLENVDDAQALATLTALKGIGNWPAGDLALAVAVLTIYLLSGQTSRWPAR